VPNPFVHIEIRTRDMAKCKTFYEKVFDWQVNEQAGYGLIDTGTPVWRPAPRQATAFRMVCCNSMSKAPPWDPGGEEQQDRCHWGRPADTSEKCAH